MRFLPFENLSYHTSLSQAETIQALSTLIQSGQYSGTINQQPFVIKRVIRYRNSFLPIIKGTIQSDSYGTTITVKMRLNLFVLIFLGIWLGIVVFALLVTLFVSNESGPIMSLFPLGMLLFAYLLVTFGFRPESNKAKKDLQQLWKAELRGSA